MPDLSERIPRDIRESQLRIAVGADNRPRYSEEEIGKILNGETGVVVREEVPTKLGVPEEVIDGQFREEPKYYSNIRIDLETARNGYKGLRGEAARQGREAIRSRLEKAGIEFEGETPVDPYDIEHQKPEWIEEQMKRQARGEKTDRPVKEINLGTDTENEGTNSNIRGEANKSQADMARDLYQRAMRIPVTNANGRNARNDLLLQVIRTSGDIPQQLIDDAVDGLSYPDVTPAVEPKEVMDIDDLRAEFHMVMNEQLFSKNGSVDPVTEIFVNQWLNDRGLSGVQNKQTRDEFMKYMTLMNMRAASRHFEDNPAILSKVIGKEGVEGQGEDLDTKWKRAYLAGYQDRQILGVLETQETDGFRKDNVASALKMFAEEVMAARSGAQDRDLSEWALFYRANEPAKPEFELSYISAVAERLGITEYEASVGYSMFEALLEPEYNTRHPLYSITHPREHATALRFSIWWGSSAWWNPEITGDPSGQACAMPERLWAPAGIMYPDLMTQILAGNGVDEIVDIIKNPAKAGQGILTKNFADIAKAMNLHKLFTDVGPGTPGVKMDANILWKIKDLTSVLMTPIDDVDNKKMNYYNANQAVDNLLNAAKVFFWEISVRNPNYRNDEDRGILRAVSPKGMFDRFVTWSTKRDGFAFFEFKGATGALSIKMSTNHNVVRSYVSGIIRSFFSADPMIPLPEGEKTVTSSVLDSLPEKPIDDRGKADKELVRRAGTGDMLSQIGAAGYANKRNRIADLERSAEGDTNPLTKALKKFGASYLKS